MRNDESKSVSMKGVMVRCKNNPRTATMITFKIYMHLWHKCLLMTKVLVEILMKVRNWPIWFFDSGETSQMTPQYLDFIPGSLEYKDEYIEVANEYYVTVKRKGQVQIKMCNDNGIFFIST